VGYPQKRTLAFGKHWSPYFRPFARWDTKLFDEKPDHRLKGNAGVWKVDPLKGCTPREAVLGKGTPDLEMRSRVRISRMTEIVISKHPSLPLRVYLVLVAGILDLEAYALLRLDEEECHGEPQVIPIGEREGILGAIPSPQDLNIGPRS
jgi:hypothetical protein